MWEREVEFRDTLEQVLVKAAGSRLERLASLAVEDERTVPGRQVAACERGARSSMQRALAASTHLA